MPTVSRYERLQIESILGSDDAQAEATALVLMPEGEAYQRVYLAAIRPALVKNGFESANLPRAFDSESSLARVGRSLRGAELIIADLTDLNPAVLYVLGICHGIGRCPLIVMLKGTSLPFNLAALRCIEYTVDHEGLLDLREATGRAVRVFVSAARAKSDQPPDDDLAPPP